MSGKRSDDGRRRTASGSSLLNSRLEPPPNPFTLHEQQRRGGNRIRYEDDNQSMTETGSKVSLASRYQRQHYSSTTLGTQGSQTGARRARESTGGPTLKVEVGESDMLKVRPAHSLPASHVTPMAVVAGTCTVSPVALVAQRVAPL